MNGRKRHIITDVLGLIIGLLVHSAGVQDRDGAASLLSALTGRLPRMKVILADGAYGGGILERVRDIFGPGDRGGEPSPRIWPRTCQSCISQ